MKKTIVVGIVLSFVLLVMGFWGVRKHFFIGGNSAVVERADFQTEFPIFLEKKELNLRLALTDLERQHGLTGCRGLDRNTGMLFVYPDATSRAFWMRGVPIDLSIGFFDENGILLEVHEMRAQDLATTYSRARDVKFVLEMSSHWFDENEMLKGSQLDLNALLIAVKARGFSIERLSLSGKK